jgi:cellobiose-specific phosphotransferase system component IIA
MQEASPKISTDQLLSELAETLREERAALIRLDTEAIERSAADKSRLSDALAQRRSELTTAHRARLDALQTDLRHNLILLVHAKDHIQSTLGILTGCNSLPGQMRKLVADSVRLDLRG